MEPRPRNQPSPHQGRQHDSNALANKYQEIVERVAETLNNCSDVKHDQVSPWKRQAADMAIMSGCTPVKIALVGPSASGKSSLLNALLCRGDLLPYSGTGRACTTTVVHISGTTQQDEANIEFLTEEEWKERACGLLDELKDEDGNLLTDEPEVGSEQYGAWCELAAVYGRFRPVDVNSYDFLAQNRDLTELCERGAKLIRNESDISTFKEELRKYIMDNDSNGQEMWPLVKQVRVKISGCDILKGGVVLVDLPGLRDSNMSRVKIARDYLVDCDEIWLVSNVERVLSDSTVSELFTDKFLRQMIMDGNVRSLVVVCNKTDSSLNLADRNRIKSVNKDQITAASGSRSDEKAMLFDLALARNEHIKKKIRDLFEIKLQKIQGEAARQGESTVAGGGLAPVDAHASAEQLKVFCCSAASYLRLRGQPTCAIYEVFKSDGETEIPQLIEHAIGVMDERKLSFEQRHVRRLANFMDEVIRGLLYSGTKDASIADKAGGVLKRHFAQLFTETESASDKTTVKATMDDIGGQLDQLEPYLQRGVTNAQQRASKTISDRVGLWHRNTLRALVKRNGDFCTGIRGQLNLNEDLAEPLYKQIASAWNAIFNTNIPERLDQFEDDLVKELETFCKSLNTDFMNVARVPQDDLLMFHVRQAFTPTPVKMRLSEFINELKVHVQKEQTRINRVITEVIQEEMAPGYADCCSLSSDEMKRVLLTRLRAINEAQPGAAATQSKMNVFEEAAEKMRTELNMLQNEIETRLAKAFHSVYDFIKSLYKPLCERRASDQPARKRVAREILQYAETICTLLRETGVEPLQCDEFSKAFGYLALMAEEAAESDGDDVEVLRDAVGTGMQI
jgi:predicted GTPase/gas vesicle protein